MFDYASPRPSRIWMMMIILIFLCLIASFASAQDIATSQSRLGWDQGAADQLQANTFGANFYLDNAFTGTPVTGKVCIGAVSPYQCSATLPALTVGVHILRLSATFNNTESAVSQPLNFTMVIVVTPTGLRIVGGNTP